jgi:hypothetical protein
MSGVKISNLPAATVPLTGTELVAVVQSGVTVQVPVSAVPGGVGSFTSLSVSGASTLTGGAVVQGLTVGKGNNAISSNTAVGVNALATNTTGAYNSSIGINALKFNADGGYNSAFGASTLVSNTSGNYNSAFGVSALQVNTTGNDNTAIGVGALASNIGGNYNSALGYNALSANTSGNNNIAIGLSALVLNTTGSSNSAIGTGALGNNISGSVNVALGNSALLSSTGTNNLALGYNAGQSLTTGNNNTIIGSVTGTAGLSDTVIIAAGSTERMRIDSAGAMSVPAKILVGGPTSAAGAFGVQVYGDSSTYAPSVVQRGYSNTTAGPSLLFVKTRGTTATSTTAVQSGDTLGSVAFYGADGTANQVFAAIAGIVDGAVSAGVVPTSITFTTGTSVGSQRAVITSAGLMGIGTGTPASCAIVDVTSTTLGFKFPVMTTTQKNAIASPVAGLVVFDSTLAKLCVYSGSAWQTITSV